MVKATFYCKIVSEDGQLLETDFPFDEGEFSDRQAVDRYCKSCGYTIGDPCGYWGNDVGILTEILYETF